MKSVMSRQAITAIMVIMAMDTEIKRNSDENKDLYNKYVGIRRTKRTGSGGGLPLFFPGYRMGGGCEREATYGGTDRTVI